MLSLGLEQALQPLNLLIPLSDGIPQRVNLSVHVRKMVWSGSGTGGCMTADMNLLLTEVDRPGHGSSTGIC